MVAKGSRPCPSISEHRPKLRGSLQVVDVAPILMTGYGGVSLPCSGTVLLSQLWSFLWRRLSLCHHRVAPQPLPLPGPAALPPSTVCVPGLSGSSKTCWHRALARRAREGWILAPVVLTKRTGLCASRRRGPYSSTGLCASRGRRPMGGGSQQWPCKKKKGGESTF